MLLAIGISHKTAPIEVREKLAFSQDALKEAILSLANDLAMDEIALLSTCNRTEFYFSPSVVTAFSLEAFLGWWQNYHALNFDLQPYIYRLSNENAVRHVMRVASGLDSMVLGEPQILGQLKSAYETANQIGSVGKKLSRLFHLSFWVAKKIRSSTGIASHPVSVAFAAVTLARQIFSDLSKTTVLLIGAGENTELLLQHLVARKVKEIIIANRTLEHASDLASRYGAKAISLSALPMYLPMADIVMSSTATQQFILTKAQIDLAILSRKRRPILIVDLGVPRNVEPSAANHEDIYLYTVDDLQGIITENLKNREIAAVEAESVVKEASDEYMNWVALQQHLQVVMGLRIKAQTMKNDTLRIALNQLQKGGDPAKVVARALHQLTQKLIHEPTLTLRKMGKENSKEKIEIAKELFSIE